MDLPPQDVWAERPGNRWAISLLDGIRTPSASALYSSRACRLQAELAPADRDTHREPGLSSRAKPPRSFFLATVHGAFLAETLRAAYEIMLADAKADLMKDGQGEVDTYV